MPFIDRIVCSTDFSQPSYLGVDRAAEIAAHLEASVTLVHVVAPLQMVPHVAMTESSASPDPVTHMENASATAEYALHDIVQSHFPQEVPVELVVAEGDAGYEIVEVAKRVRANVIVIATHGRTGWRRLVFGSVAEKVVRRSCCPVLTIPIRKPARKRQDEPVTHQHWGN